MQSSAMPWDTAAVSALVLPYRPDPGQTSQLVDWKTAPVGVGCVAAATAMEQTASGCQPHCCTAAAPAGLDGVGAVVPFASFGTAHGELALWAEPTKCVSSVALSPAGPEVGATCLGEEQVKALERCDARMAAGAQCASGQEPAA
mmetsp:Transcript_58732/g.171879  ORF Transcript_58732/g.171879 Transcript_58732/m.171879 type:complete len:145 (-) Transcript_58732:279-713(-)